MNTWLDDGLQLLSIGVCHPSNRHQVSRVCGRVRCAEARSGARHQAGGNKSPHHLTVQRVLRWRGGSIRPGQADKPGQGAVPGDGYDQGRGVRLLHQHRRGDDPAHRSRAVTRKRWPNGVDEPSFFEKQLASSAPDWMGRESVTHRSGTTTYPVIDTVEGLAWIGQQAALEVHVPQWQFVDGKPGPATRLVFDLDPGEGVTMTQLCKVASEVRDLMSDIGLTAYPLTSGSKGLHLYAPLETPVSSHGAVVLAKRVAQQLEKAMPKLVTSTMTKSLRSGKVFLDWSQNNGSKTTIAPTRCADANNPPSPRREHGTRSRTPSCGTCASTRCSSASLKTATCWRIWTKRCPSRTG